MAYGIFCTVLGAELLFSGHHWTLKIIGGAAVFAGVLMMAGEEKTAKKVSSLLLEMGLKICGKDKK